MRTARHPLLALTLVASLGGCGAVRQYAKDLLDPRASAAVSVPVKLAIGLFVLPPTIVWLPISIAPLLILHDEGAVWFALAPGLVIGGPFVLLFGTPGYVATDRPPPLPSEHAAAVTSASVPDQTAALGSSSPSRR